jgi:hypothetical protein
LRALVDQVHNIIEKNLVAPGCGGNDIDTNARDTLAVAAKQPSRRHELAPSAQNHET